MNKKYYLFTSFLLVSIIPVLILYFNLQNKPPLQEKFSNSPSKVFLPIVQNPMPVPSDNWEFSLSESTLVPNSLNVPIYQWFPDGHISILQDETGNWMMFWAEFESYRSSGNGPFPENQIRLSPETKVLGRRGGTGWDNGGSWLNSVFRLSGQNLVGFYHAEDHWSPPNSEGIAWKSIAVTYSNDNGITWSSGGQIITAWKSRPASPEWGGAGDHSVVWDAENKRWVCFYQEQVNNGEAQIHIAVSTDVNGSPGTWYKWDGHTFTIPGIGGQGKPVPAFYGHEGGNPSVHENTYLGKWIMVYGGWDGIIYISSSEDLINWDTPRSLVMSDQNGRAWYPTIIGDFGDVLAGQNARLYYADIASDFSSRKFYVRTITFYRNDE